MAENVVLNAGAGGDTVAADEIGAVKHQRVKLSVGADGTASDAIPVSNGLDTTAAGVQAVGLVAQFDDTAPSAVTENQFAPVRLSSRRALLVEGVASGTAQPVSDGGGSLTVDGTVGVSGTVTVDGSGVTQPVSHAALTELAAAIDTEVQCDIVGALPAGNNNIGDVDVASLPSATTAAATTVAHDAADSGHPIKIGGRADTTFQAAASDGDRVDALFDVYGVQFARGDHPNKWSYHADGSSALTDATVQAAPGAGLSNYITDIIVSLGAASALNTFLEEGATKILGPYYLEAINGRSLHIRFNTPKKCTANTAVTVTTSAAVAHAVDILGFIAP